MRAWRFLLTPLREGRRPAGAGSWGCPSSFLLTPLREGRPPHSRVISVKAVSISTHAPAGGATHAELIFDLPAHISTHAPAGGATGGMLCIGCSPCISTHAPAGGATVPLTSMRIASTVFLLTPLREGRPAARFSRFVPAFHFYSRPCGRGDIHTSFRPSLPLLFLLTPLREGRHFGVCLSFGSDVFLLTPLREGRLEPGQIFAAVASISTHAPAGGATNDCDLLARRCRISTHAPAGGATASESAKTEDDAQFLLTPLREGRLLQRDCGRTRSPISTHAPAGGATDSGRADTARN